MFNSKYKHKPREITFTVNTFGYNKTRVIPNCAYSEINDLIKLVNLYSKWYKESAKLNVHDTYQRYRTLLKTIADDNDIKLIEKEI